MTIDRFIKAHNNSYNVALNEIKNGKKITHWMWYIFPQIKGLGKSSTAIYYSINDIKEAKEYYSNKLLHDHLIEICTELLKINDTIENIFGYPDYLKLQSCLTLFIQIDNNKIFNDVIDKFYNGKLDINTLEILGDINE